MKLTNPTDDELNEEFAVRVAGWTFITFPNGACPAIKHWKDDSGKYALFHTKGQFTKSADATLPWLERSGWSWEREYHGPSEPGDFGYTELWVYGPADTQFGYHRVANAPGEFPRAAVIALLRAHGVEVEL